MIEFDKIPRKNQPKPLVLPVVQADASPRPAAEGLDLRIDMFGPSSRREIPLIQTLYGPTSKDLMRARPEENPTLDPHNDAWLRKIDDYFYRGLRKKLEVPRTTNIRTFYADSLKVANLTLVDYIKKVFPDYMDTFGLLNSNAQPSQRAHDALYLALSPNPEQAFHTKRQLILAAVAMQIAARRLNNDLEQEFADVQTLLDNRLYEKSDAAGEIVTTYALHDNKTNDFLDFVQLEAGAMPVLKDHTHIKKHEKRMRSIEGVGRVLTNVNIKSLESSVMKTLRKALKNKEEGGTGKIDPDIAVQDELRMMFAVEGTTSIDDPRIDRLIIKVKNLLYQSSQDPRTRMGDITAIDPDDETNGTPDQSKRVKFKRLQVQFAKLPIPVEIAFYDYAGYINTQLSVGERNPITGLHDGAAHEIYDSNRLVSLLPYLFPENVIQHNGINMNDAAIRRQEEIVQKLKRQGTVHGLSTIDYSINNNHHSPNKLPEEDVVFRARSIA